MFHLHDKLSKSLFCISVLITYILLLNCSCTVALSSKLSSYRKLAPLSLIIPLVTLSIPQPDDAAIPLEATQSTSNVISKPYLNSIEISRKKRNAAIKMLSDKKVLVVDTDDSGNQFLYLPWVPDKKVPYKSLSVQQRLVNEVCAGAFGEISKDTLLHWVDTAKTRRQAQKKPSTSDLLPNTSNSTTAISTTKSAIPAVNISLSSFFELYAGFPIVAAASIPQGGMFFLAKKGLLELQHLYYPQIPESFVTPITICVGVSAYWLFRTPAEVIKTQVQTRQEPSVQAALATASANDKGVLNLWRYYTVMLSLDIPFQIVNFILYGLLTDYVISSGLPANSILTRLLCGIACGMIAAGLTCPLDVCKTRIISRDKARVLAEKNENKMSGSYNNSMEIVAPLNQNKNMWIELTTIAKEEGLSTLFLGIRQRLLYTGLANGIRLAAYGTSKMDLMMKSLDEL